MEYNESLNAPKNVPWGKCIYNPCRCYRNFALCSGLNLTFIPRFPDNITYLYMYKNCLGRVNRSTFLNLTNPLTRKSKLEVLILVKNRINTLSNDSFADLSDLTHIHIEDEQHLSGQQFSESFNSLSPKLVKLIINRVNLTSIPATFFQGLESTNVLNITLESNAIKTLDGNLFSPVTSLRNLSLHGNRLETETTNFSHLSNVEYLNLSSNYFNVSPNFCNFNLSSLKILDFQSNKFSTFKEFKCLDNLEYLNLNNHAIRTLFSNTFSMLPKLKTLHLSQMAEQLEFIQNNAFNSSSLKRLYFIDNAFHFSLFPRNFYPLLIFENTRKLQVLDLSMNYFKVNETIFTQMLTPLTNLKSLIIVECVLRYIPRGLLRVLPQLRELILSRNSIDEWNGYEVFGKSKTLRYLDLSDNRIVTVDEKSFPPDFLQSIRFINLGNNPFSCTCKEVQWFHDWAIDNRQKICPKTEICKTILCASPSSLKNKIIIELTESEMCPYPEYVKVLIIIGSVSLFVLVIALVVYKARWHIRYLIYMYRLRRDGYETIEDKRDFNYDAFVVYAEEDQGFVHNTLVPTLEEREGYHLCIHNRDFQVGKLIVDNIITSIQTSRKIIVVLSNNFTKSKWCDFELIIVQNRMVLEQNNNLVVILIDKIEPKNITTPLRLILSTMTYAKWQAQGTEDEKESFWNQIRDSLRK